MIFGSTPTLIGGSTSISASNTVIIPGLSAIPTA